MQLNGPEVLWCNAGGGSGSTGTRTPLDAVLISKWGGVRFRWCAWQGGFGSDGVHHTSGIIIFARFYKVFDICAVVHTIGTEPPCRSVISKWGGVRIRWCAMPEGVRVPPEPEPP